MTISGMTSEMKISVEYAGTAAELEAGERERGRGCR